MTTFCTDLTPENAPAPEAFDAFLLVSFGGPEGPDDVMPFLENVLRGKNVPHERMLEVAEHYKHFGGKSPINDQNRELLDALGKEFEAAGVTLPIYWGNRNWDPTITDALSQIRSDGKKNVIAFFTSMFSCYSGCRQYRENITDSQQKIGDDAPTVVRLRLGFNHPGFIKAMSDRVGEALANFDVSDQERAATKILFTAHSIPISMADNCDYVKQLTEASRLVAEANNNSNWELVFQSRSGPPQIPWLEPDVCDRIEELHGDNHESSGALSRLVVAPIGFVSDHMEVIYDLDDEAAETCRELGIEMYRAGTVGTHPAFVGMVRELIQERMSQSCERPTVGELPACHDVCPSDCCTYTPRRPGRPGPR